MMMLYKHFPALQVLIPFFGAMFAAISTNYSTARIISIVCIACNACLGIGCLIVTRDGAIYYNFGNWSPSIGIEYKLDMLNQPVIIYMNLVLLFFLICGYGLTINSVLKFIHSNRRSLFYAVLLFAHSGYVGLVSTNDLFNLYVFIEISSLGAYVLMAQGNHPKAAIGAFDYLILGTIGATLILLGIGCLLSVVGSLNMTVIYTNLAEVHTNKLFIIGSSFIITGCLLKVAFFPMHFWTVRSYTSAPSCILMYLAGISTVVGAYVLMRFMCDVIEYQFIQSIVSSLLRPLALITIGVCSIFAVLQSKMKKIIIYAALAQVGYVILLILITTNVKLLYQFLFVDGINKISLFLLASYIDVYTPNVNYLRSVSKSRVEIYHILIAIVLICSSGLPINSMFIIKCKIFELLISQNLIIDLVAVIFGAVCTLLYHAKIAQYLLFHVDLSVVPTMRGLYPLLIGQFLMMLSL